MAENPSQSSPAITAELCEWVNSLQLADIPDDVVTRTKYLVLDGLGCAIIGSRLPWSETGTRAVLSMESAGSCSVWGWNKKVGPLAAALLNSSFIQAFELDDFHSESPIHSSSVVLPALCALVQHDHSSITDSQFLLAALIGYEVGPRIGFGLWGGDILSRGWHSGAVFGPAAAAAASSKLLGLSVEKIEDAIGIACTQACGLMSAQYGSMVKRMQHGFASRNGLFSAIMASQDYTGIDKVLETPYGGFISTFGNGGTRDPPTTPHRITENLGKNWELQNINVKPYASMAATHGTIDCIRKVQEQHPDVLSDVEAIDEIVVEMSEPAFKKGGWSPKRPVEMTSAQMSAPYAAASQIVDGAVLVGQFTPASLDRDEVWKWVDKIQCVHNTEFNKDKKTMWFQRMTTTFKDQTREKIEVFVEAPRGVKPLLTNEEIREKWKMLTGGIIDVETRDRIEQIVLSLGSGADLAELVELLGRDTEKLRGF
ncbi:2-methylcitrate dehydratase PrpD [Hypoxylon trugodes]|uniref:2-methylcitrate dehydratase PrpD n=1 Tax=Hypoxylon trugodes TaxID=326681 RepID=UPI00218DB1D3|nr:2-methylcitrate dehydratase PrpD [Hypoxylon trugodes]KAI1386456.1 2-methylcitrate dehydratase PrpD [Hypoxylon trugodes]